MIFIESLPLSILNEVKMDYCTRIENSGFYTPEEVKEFMLDLPNQYIKDMDVAIDKLLHDYITLFAECSKLLEMGVPDRELAVLPTLYKVIDTQDELNFEYHTLRTAKIYLQDFWNDNPDEDSSDEEHGEWIATIGKTNDPKELNEMLQGIGYYLEEAFQ